MSVIEGKNDFTRNLICIEYPGVIRNVDKMLETLGGLNNVSLVYSQKKRRLELRFRPDDVFAKPACGDRHSTSALLLQIKIRRKVKRISNSNLSEDKTIGEGEEGIISCESSVVGKISTVYKFSSMCDFQYLPLGIDLEGNSRSVYEDIVPLGAKDYSWLLNQNLPLFVLPPSFSRMDTPQSYSFRRGKDAPDPPLNPQAKVQSGGNLPKNVIGRTRCRRSLYTIFVSWHKFWAAKKLEKLKKKTEDGEEADKECSEVGAGDLRLMPSCSSSMANVGNAAIPTKPQDTALRLLRIKFLCGEPFLRLQKFLEERPVWSKNALIAKTKLTHDQLKYLLPTVAYYFVNGPWRCSWVRFGYDPSTTPSSRQYQTLDFRLRRQGGMRNKIKAKRNVVNCSQPYKWVSCSRPKIPILKKVAIEETQEDKNEEEDANKTESLYVFRPGLVPPSMQMFYQYCDLQVPEIQEMLDALPESGPDLVCTERSGWMPPGFDERCRDIINRYVAHHFLEADQNEK